jgi:pimeloyl-ACP methyl ester carboxylesterase
MRLNHLDQGVGRPVILLHGLFGAAKNLGVLARALAAEHRVISMDMRNHGDSPHDALMDYESMAADVAETMEALGVTAADLVGHSMGGKAAMVLALTRPALVTRLAVLDIAPVTYHHNHSAFVAAMQAIPLTAGLTRAQADAALTDVVPEAPMRAFLLNNLILGDQPRWRLGLAEIGGAMQPLFEWHDRGLPFDGQALFLRGGTSHYVPAASEPEIKRLFPRAAIETVEGAGHWLHAEKPQEVIAALQGFLGGQKV